MYISGRKKRFLKRIFFALIPLIALCAAATIILSRLEKKEVIQTERPDDFVAYAPVDFLTKSEEGFWKIEHPQMMKSTFPVLKEPEVFRIIITGGSFAMGAPYNEPGKSAEIKVGLPDWIFYYLSAMYPSRKFEIINAAAQGANSGRVYEILAEIIDIDPDIIIVISGNNEGFVPSTALNETLHKWIVYRALKKGFTSDPPLSERPAFPPQAGHKERILEYYENKIGSIVKAAKKSAIPLAIATLPVNLKWEGHVLDDRMESPLPLDDFLQSGNNLRRAGDCSGAIVEYSKSSDHLVSTRLIAECFEILGDYQEAAEFYRASVEIAPKFRTPPSINEIARKKSQEEKLVLCDLEKYFESRQPAGIADPSLFIDYCHLNWEGYRLAARQISLSLSKSGIIQATKGEPKKPPSLEKIKEQYSLNNLESLHDILNLAPYP